MNAPLDGIRVLDLGISTAGPYSARFLADLGADVIKVEPVDGENSRALGLRYGDTGYLYHVNNYNKKAVTLQVQHARGRELFLKCFHEGKGVYNTRSQKNENEVYLDLTHIPEATLRQKLAGILEIYEKFVNEDPYHNPMRVFPAVHYSMGGLWVDFERREDGGLVRGSGRWSRPGEKDAIISVAGRGAT